MQTPAIRKFNEAGLLHGVLPVVAIAAISASLAFRNLDFPLGFHWDEPLKLSFLSGAPHNYAHPPLMIVLARLLVWLSGASNPEAMLLAGRTVSALSAVGASVLFYLVLRRHADRWNAFVWSCVFATSPAIAVHAHFFKEDAVLVMTICLGLYALVRLKERQGALDLVFFGIALGLADTAKYVGVGNSFVLFAVAIYFCRLSLRGALLVVLAAMLTVLGVFGLSFLTETGSGLSTLQSGLLSELRHAENGHDLSEWFFAGYGLTHFRYHLIPSLTLATVILSLATIGWAVAMQRNRQVAAFAAGAALWLFALELSPLKIVGSMRYVLPVVIYLLLAAGIACSALAASRSRLLATAIGLAALAVTAHAGLSYVGNLTEERDTRIAAMDFMATLGSNSFVVDYPMGRPATMTDGYRDLAPVDYLVSVQSQYFLRGGGLSEQSSDVYRIASLFRCLEGYVVGQFSRLYGDYGYVAPTVKIYDLRRARACIPA